MTDDRKLFSGTAQYYAKFRSGYPPAFFDFARKEFKLDGTSRLLDLGCGTGQVFIPFAEDFEEIIAVDPEPEMLVEAKRQARKSRIRNVKWVCATAEDFLEEDVGSFRLVTMGASFHWMRKQKTVLKRIYKILEPNGALILLHNPSSGWRSQKEKWKAVRKKVVQEYLGEKRRAGNSFYQVGDEWWEDLLDDSPFGGHTTWEYRYNLSWTLKGVIGYLYSTSFASRRLFGRKLPQFEKELREKLMALEPSGSFKERISLEALIARK